QHDFERARDTRTIVDCHTLRSYRVEPRKFCMQRGRAFALHAASDLGSNIRRDCRHSGEACCQRFEIKASAANQNWYAPLCGRFIEDLFDVLAPASYRVILCRIDK